MTSENEPAKERVRRIGQLTKDINGFTRSIREDLEKCSDDLILLTLKGHLIVEQLLENVLIIALAIPKLPDENC